MSARCGTVVLCVNNRYTGQRAPSIGAIGEGASYPSEATK